MNYRETRSQSQKTHIMNTGTLSTIPAIDSFVSFLSENQKRSGKKNVMNYNFRQHHDVCRALRFHVLNMLSVAAVARSGATLDPLRAYARSRCYPSKPFSRFSPCGNQSSTNCSLSTTKCCRAVRSSPSPPHVPSSAWWRTLVTEAAALLPLSVSGDYTVRSL